MKLTRTIQTWVTGASAASITLSLSEAAVTRLSLDHDLTTSLDGVAFGSLGVDAGQWIAGTSNSAYGGMALAEYSSVNGAASSMAILNNGSFGIGAIGATSASGLAVGQVVTSYVAWDLASGVEGWLEVSAMRQADSSNTDPALSPLLFATGFIYDDEHEDLGTGGSVTERPTYDPALFDSLSVPEPSGISLLALGATGVLLQRRRKA